MTALQNFVVFCQTSTWISHEGESESHVQLFATPWTIQSMEFSRPEYWSGKPFPSPADLPDPGRSPTWVSYIAGGFFTNSAIREAPVSVGIHMSPPFWNSLPSPSPAHTSRLIQSPCLSFLSHTANSHWPSILHVVMSVSMLLLHTSPPPLPLPMSTSLFSVPVSPLLPCK